MPVGEQSWGWGISQQCPLNGMGTSQSPLQAPFQQGLSFPGPHGWLPCSQTAIPFLFRLSWTLLGVQTLDLALIFLPAQPFQKAILLLLCACDAFPFGSPANFISKAIVSGPAPASAFKLIYQHTLWLPSLVQFLLIQQSNLCPHFPTLFFPTPLYFHAALSHILYQMKGRWTNPDSNPSQMQ